MWTMYYSNGIPRLSGGVVLDFSFYLPSPLGAAIFLFFLRLRYFKRTSSEKNRTLLELEHTSVYFKCQKDQEFLVDYIQRTRTVEGKNASSGMKVSTFIVASHLLPMNARVSQSITNIICGSLHLVQLSPGSASSMTQGVNWHKHFCKSRKLQIEKTG